MFDDITTFTAPSSALDGLRAYLGEHHGGLLNAAALLGGQPGIRSAQSVLDDFETPGTPPRRTMRALDDLLDLLMLENVHDPDRIEAAHFAMLDPASPIVEEICLLADGLDDVLDTYRRALEPILAQQVAA